jgi:ParB-like chromosome segregation protein Spo0J
MSQNLPVNSQSLNRCQGTQITVVDLHTDDVGPAPGNRPVTIEDVKDLLPSMGNPAIGQQLAGIVYLNPDGIPKNLCADGNRRLFVCRVLGLKFKAIVLDKAPSNTELRRIRLTTNFIRKGMTAEQIAADIAAHIEETGDTQEATADYFGISAGYVSKLLDRKNLLPELEHLRGNAGICSDVVRIIAGMRTAEMQRQLAAKVLTLVATNGKAKRDIVEEYAKRMKGGNGRKKDKAMKISYGGVAAVVKGNVIEALKAFGAKLAEAIKRIERDNLPPEYLAGFMK